MTDRKVSNSYLSRLAVQQVIIAEKDVVPVLAAVITTAAVAARAHAAPVLEHKCARTVQATILQKRVGSRPRAERSRGEIDR